MIISNLINVVNYDTNGDRTTIWDEITQIKNMSSDISQFSNSFKELFASGKNIDELINKFPNLSDNIKNIAKDVTDGKKSMSDFDLAINQASFSTSKFTAALKSAAANIGIMLIINFAIKGLVKLWDYLNETVEEQEQKISELKSSYEGLKSEYDELSQKQDITDAEKHRLEYLERRLELDERILKAEQAQLFDEKTGKKFTDLFDKDNLNTQYLNEMDPRNKEGFKIHSLF